MSKSGVIERAVFIPSCILAAGDIFRVVDNTLGTRGYDPQPAWMSDSG
jgi:hypothetical protein